MALDATVLQKKIEAALIAGFAREFKEEEAKSPVAIASHKKQAAAISDIAKVIVETLISSVQVMPGIAIVGTSPVGPVTGQTSSPGKIQ